MPLGCACRPIRSALASPAPADASLRRQRRFATTSRRTASGIAGFRSDYPASPADRTAVRGKSSPALRADGLPFASARDGTVLGRNQSSCRLTTDRSLPALRRCDAELRVSSNHDSGSTGRRHRRRGNRPPGQRQPLHPVPRVDLRLENSPSMRRRRLAPPAACHENPASLLQSGTPLNFEKPRERVFPQLLRRRTLITSPGSPGRCPQNRVTRVSIRPMRPERQIVREFWKDGRYWTIRFACVCCHRSGR